MALMDTDSDNYVSAAELRTYAAKVPPMIRFAPPPLGFTAAALCDLSFTSTALCE